MARSNRSIARPRADTRREEIIFRVLSIFRFPACALLSSSLVLAGCGGSSTAPPTQLLTTTTTTPYNGVAQTIPFTQESYTGTLSVPQASAAPPGDILTLTASQAPFSEPPAIQDARKRTTTSAATLIYFEITASATTVLSAPPSFSLHIPATVHAADGPFFIAFYDPTASSPAWNYAFEGPGVVSDATLTFTPSSASPFTLQGGTHYFFCVYQRATPITSPSPTDAAGASPMPSASPNAAPTPTSTPTPTPSVSPTPSPTPHATGTPTPTPAPSGSLGLTPNAVSLSGVGGAYAQTTTLQESGYSGAFFESDTCSSIATIASNANSGPSSLITVTGLTSGTCSATFRDAFGQSATVNITVTVSGFSISMTGSGKETT